MKKSERLITALITIALGVLLIVLRGDLISILMTVVGLGLIALGVMDLIDNRIPPAVVKLVGGVVVIVCGWVIVEAVLYLVAGALLIAGILLLYEKIKSRSRCDTLFYTLCEYAVPVVFLVIGTLLMFNQGNTVNWVFIFGGIFTIIEGGLLLVGALSDD
ncbi:MAG: DUF308 domain-containing protein [Clostridia bacterium]|nr:DUF308 domain-containing protein [Clostridia bacterium]